MEINVAAEMLVYV